jgi:hypothetical protein
MKNTGFQILLIVVFCSFTSLAFAADTLIYNNSTYMILTYMIMEPVAAGWLKSFLLDIEILLQPAGHESHFTLLHG